MTRGPHLCELRTDVDDRLASVFDAGEGGYLADVLPAPTAREDRWYGQMVGVSYGALADEYDPHRVLSAATSVELLREYSLLRGELLVQLDERGAHSMHREPTAALLAGDYLLSAAFSALEPFDAVQNTAGFDPLTEASQTVVAAFGRSHGEETPSPADINAYFDDTAGALGRSAAVIGASLALAEESNRSRFATLGDGVGTARRISRFLDGDSGSASVVSPIPEHRPLRAHAERRLRSARHALEELSSTMDVVSVRRFVRTSVPEDLE